MRRRAFTLVEIMIVVLIIGMILTIAVPSWMRIREKSQRTACQDNMRVIRDAKVQWGLDNGQSQSAVPTQADIAPVHIKKFPNCPGSGTYTIGNLDEDVACSEHGPIDN
ncbi:MAG: competence type IV pilus major pilin ComGC [Fimbriimonadaceae bacterium]